MFDLRLISILGLLTIVVIAGLVLDYLGLLRRPARLGLGLALLGIIAGLYITIQAVLPGDYFYGPVLTEGEPTRSWWRLLLTMALIRRIPDRYWISLKSIKCRQPSLWLATMLEKYPELVARAAAEGHQIGNHTYDHH